MTSTTGRRQSVSAHPNSKVTVAYEAIRGRIADGSYPSGTRLVLDRIARELGMSTLPVREAIRRLEAEALVQFQQNVGATVAAFDAQSFVDAVQTLAVLESAAAAQAAPHLTDDDLREAALLNEAMAAALDALDGAAYTARHDEFHERLNSKCPNTHLTRMIAQERARLRRVRLSTMALGQGGRREIDEHTRLLRLIADGASADDIEALSREHVSASIGSLVRAPQVAAD